LYTRPKKIDGKYVYAVFQVRVRPGKSFKIQGNTLDDPLWGNVKILYDTHFGADELEWLFEDPDDIRVTGLMIKTDTREPYDVVKEKFENNKKLVSVKENLTKKQAVWYWNCDSDYTLKNDGKFQAYTTAQNYLIERAYRNGQNAVWLGSVQTSESENSPYFINFDAMEQVNCKDNTKRRRIKRVEKG